MYLNIGYEVKILKYDLGLRFPHFLLYIRRNHIGSIKVPFFRFFLHYRPPGVFEFNNFAKGTKAVMDAVVMATQNGATVIIG